MRTAKAFISGCAGLRLSADERAFFKDERPWGLILFKRNCDDPAQIRDLVADFRAIVKRADAPVLIDQEGGRVRRLRPPHWPDYPAAAAFSRINDPLEAASFARLGARLIAHDLRSLGISVNCAPVLDVPLEGSHDIVGDRAYARTPEGVAVLARAAAEGFLAGSVLPIIKHMPGHGRALADSHLELPHVGASLAALKGHDFVPFAMLSDMPAAMSAHVVFTAIDKKNPATTSRKVVRRIMRGLLGFQNLLISDDLSMKALSGSFGERTKAMFAAGLDMALHCNGDMKEMQAVAANAPKLAGKARQRARAALGRISHRPEPLDVEAMRERFNAKVAQLSVSG